MQITVTNILIVVYLLSWNVTYSQQCPKYEKAIKAGNTFLNEKKYREAIVEFQTAQIAARECDLSGEVLADKFKKVFDGLSKQKDEADANRVIAEKATLQAKEGLVKEQNEKKRAEILKDFARSQAYASAAYTFCEKDPTMAISFAFSSLSIHKNSMALIALLKAFNINSWFYNRYWENFGDADLSPDGNCVAMVGLQSKLKIEDLRTKKFVTYPWKAENIRYLPNGNILLWSEMYFGRALGELKILNRDGKEICDHSLRFMGLTVDNKGSVVFPAMDEGRIQICRVNPENGELKKLLLPESFRNIPPTYAVSSQFTILCDESIWVSTNCESWILINTPTHKKVKSVDINKWNAVFYLSSTVNGEPDAIGILNLDGLNAGRKMNILPLLQVDDTGATGVVKFLNENTVIASSTVGWSKILNLSSKIFYSINGCRGSDQIIPFPRDSFFVMGRRSGEITVYDFKGVVISSLQGSASSDGLNQAFEKIAIDKNGTQVLTVSRNVARLWQRPKYDLKFESLSGNSNSAYQQNLTYLKSFNISKGFEPVKIERDPLLSTPINNLGEVFLQFQLGGYTDLFRTSLQKGIEDVVNMREEYDFGYYVDTDKRYERLFILKPELVLGLMKKEFSDGRILRISDKQNVKWVETNEFKQKSLNLNLEPIE